MKDSKRCTENDKFRSVFALMEILPYINIVVAGEQGDHLCRTNNPCQWDISTEPWISTNRTIGF